MKIVLVVIGKTSEKYLIDGISTYKKRLKHYTNFEIVEIPNLKNAKNFSKSELMRKEGNIILKKIHPSDYLVLLDIYPASEKPIKGINSKKLCLEINKNNGNAIYAPNNNTAIKWVIKNSSNLQVLVTQGAGTISKLNYQIKNKWKLKK